MPANKITLFLLLVFISVDVFSEPPPVEYFARLQDIRSVQLSPDGTKVAAVYNFHGESVLATQEPDTGTCHMLLATDNAEVKFKWAKWLNDEYLLFNYWGEAERGSVETAEGRLMSLKVNGSERESMFRLRRSDNWVPQYQDQVIDFLPEEDDFFLLKLSQNVRSTSSPIRCPYLSFVRLKRSMSTKMTGNTVDSSRHLSISRMSSGINQARLNVLVSGSRVISSWTIA